MGKTTKLAIVQDELAARGDRVMTGTVDAQVSMTEQVWRKQFDAVVKSIPESWLVHGGDGFVGIGPEYRNTSIVGLYHRLMCHGAACGWI